ncbi:MAG: hypothetical protein OMM_13965, partial [Candidatus Magnetoglobus multicellularis str. Araruama]
PYDKEEKDGILLNPKYARVVPTYIPNSFLEQDIEIKDVDLVNRFSQFIYSKEYILTPSRKNYNIKEFIGDSYKRAMWIVVGLRVGGII